MEKFLKRHKFPKLIQEIAQRDTYQLTEIAIVVKTLPTKITPYPCGFAG